MKNPNINNSNFNDPNSDNDFRDFYERDMQKIVKIERYLINKEYQRDKTLDHIFARLSILDFEINSIVSSCEKIIDTSNDKDKLNSLSELLRKKKREKKRKETKCQKLEEARRKKDIYNNHCSKCEEMTFSLNYCKTQQEVNALKRDIIKEINELDRKRAELYDLEKRIEKM